MPRTAPAKKAAPPAQTKIEDEPEDTADDSWFVSLDEVEDFVNAVFYGREGSAKTTNAATMANIGEGKVLVINAEGGLKKIALKKRGIDVSNIVVWPDPKNPEVIDGKSLNRIYRRVKVDLENDPTSWAGVIMDSASDVYVALLDSAQSKRVNIALNKGADVDEDFVDIADYGTMTKAFRDVLRKFRDLPCHFIATALERRDVDKDTGKPQYGPAVTPGLQVDLLGYVDFVIMVKPEDEDGPFRGLTRANSRYRAKDRFDVLPRVMVEPTFERILQYLRGDMDMDAPKTDPLQKRLTAEAAKAQDKDPKADETEDSEAEDTDEEAKDE